MTKMEPGSVRRREVLLILSSVMVLVLMGMSIVVPVLPLYAESFGVTSAMVGMVIAVFGLARILTDVPSGHWSEKLGRRPLIITGIVVFMVSSLLCGLSQSFWMLVAFRFVQGIGSAIYTTTAMAMLSDISTREDRGRVISTYQSTLIFGTGLGPTIGGLVAQSYGMRSPFFVSASLGVIALIWAFLRIPETRAEAGPVAARSHNATSKLPRAPGSPRALLSNGNFLLAGLMGFSIYFTQTGSRQTIVPLLGHIQLGLNEAQIGFAMTVFTMMDFVVIFFGGILADRFERRLVIILPTIVAALSLVLFAQGETYTFYLLSAAVFGLGRGISVTASMAFAADVSDEGSHGVASGLYRMLCDVGLMLGPVVLGWIADNSSYDWALYFNAALILVIVLLFGVMARGAVPRAIPRKAVAQTEI